MAIKLNRLMPLGIVLIAAMLIAGYLIFGSTTVQKTKLAHPCEDGDLSLTQQVVKAAGNTCGLRFIESEAHAETLLHEAGVCALVVAKYETATCFSCDCDSELKYSAEIPRSQVSWAVAAGWTNTRSKESIENLESSIKGLEYYIQRNEKKTLFDSDFEKTIHEKRRKELREALDHYKKLLIERTN